MTILYLHISKGKGQGFNRRKHFSEEIIFVLFIYFGEVHSYRERLITINEGESEPDLYKVIESLKNPLLRLEVLEIQKLKSLIHKINMLFTFFIKDITQKNHLAQT